jgi:hypothetical protein
VTTETKATEVNNRGREAFADAKNCGRQADGGYGDLDLRQGWPLVLPLQSAMRFGRIVNRAFKLAF